MPPAHSACGINALIDASNGGGNQTVGGSKKTSLLAASRKFWVLLNACRGFVVYKLLALHCRVSLFSDESQ